MDVIKRRFKTADVIICHEFNFFQNVVNEEVEIFMKKFIKIIEKKFGGNETFYIFATYLD